MAKIPANKKVIIPLAAVIAASIAGLVIFSPSYATAQQSNSTGTNDNSSQGLAAGPAPTIKGTISIPQILKDQINVSFADAANTAAASISGTTVVAGHLGGFQGYLVYSFKLIDTSSNTAYMVIVDPGNGQVLYKSQGHPIGGWGHGFGMGAQGLMKHRMEGGWGPGNGMSQPMPPQNQNGVGQQGWIPTQY